MRLFLDRDVGTSLGTALRAVDIDVELYNERYTSPIVTDDRWVAEVSAEGLVIITKDTKIRSRPLEREVFEAAGARAFVIATRGASRLQNLRGLLIAWPKIVELVATMPAPFMFGFNRDGVLTQYVPVPPSLSGKRR
jgi:hypothetical protein